MPRHVPLDGIRKRKKRIEGLMGKPWASDAKHGMVFINVGGAKRRVTPDLIQTVEEAAKKKMPVSGKMSGALNAKKRKK